MFGFVNKFLFKGIFENIVDDVCNMIDINLSEAGLDRYSLPDNFKCDPYVLGYFSGLVFSVEEDINGKTFTESLLSKCTYEIAKLYFPGLSNSEFDNTINANSKIIDEAQKDGIRDVRAMLYLKESTCELGFYLSSPDKFTYINKEKSEDDI